MNPRAIGGVIGGTALAIAAYFIPNWEGEKFQSYPDGGGVWTICYGHTRNVRPGMIVSQDQCDAWLESDIIEHSQAIRQCITRPMSPNQEAAFLSLAFNIGSGAFCRSTAARKFNAGDDWGACEAMKLWNQDNGKVVRGLVNRRAAESALCKKD